MMVMSDRRDRRRIKMRQVRKIIQIDDAKCDGCGLCAAACAEGAITIMDGKARLISDIYCDGLGNCLGECPQGAISILEREADPFQEEVVKAHLAKDSVARNFPCEGIHMIDRVPKPANRGQDAASSLQNWPVQLMLVPVAAPYFSDADLVVAADCVPSAYSGFHADILKGRTLIIGCPKLDNAAFYTDKLTEIFKSNTIRSVHIAIMEVPCCSGLVQIIRKALRDAGKDLPVSYSKIGVTGRILDGSGEKQQQVSDH